MPRYSEPGIWKVTFVRLFDAVFNTRFLSATDLSNLGPAVQTLAVASSPADVTPPNLTTLTFTPSLINTSLGPQTVQVDMAITDDLSGVSFAPDTPFITIIHGVFFTSPSGAQFGSTNGDFRNPPLAPISGTVLNGLWRLQATFPQFSEAGSWNAEVVLADAARNVLVLQAAQLKALGLPSNLVVIQPSLVPDGTVPAGGGTIADSTFGSRAELTVPAGVIPAGTSVAIDVLDPANINVPAPTGFNSVNSYFMNVQLSPEPPMPLPAPGVTIVLPLKNYQIPGTPLFLYRIDPATGNLVPETDSLDRPVVGRVDPGGLSATFTGVIHLSTIVAFERKAIAVTIDIKPGETPNVINAKSTGTIPVAVFSSASFDATQIDPATVTLSGASVARNNQGAWQVSVSDVNGDGLPDMVLHFETDQLLLGPADTAAVVEGQTLGGNTFRGTDSVLVIH
jgi:hypothetical protein